MSWKRLTSTPRDRTAIALASILALLLFFTTLQVEINGSESRYTTDVGEIQNALPRWGTIHFSGYPQFTALGSVYVNGMRLFGVAPAAGASLFSATWGAVSAGLLTALILELGVSWQPALVASLLFCLSTSMWVDSSIAELHTMTMALTLASMLAAIRFRRRGRPIDLYWLVFLSSQGLVHQRAFAFIAPALFVLIIERWRQVLQKWRPILGLVLSGPITYLYLPLVDWLGSEWVFSAPGTQRGFLDLVLDTKAERIVSMPDSLGAWGTRFRELIDLLNGDWPWFLWISGLVGLSMFWRRLNRTERIALGLSWLVYLVVSLIIWVGYVGDALLAVKLPVIAMAAIGLAFIAGDMEMRAKRLGLFANIIGIVAATFLFFGHRPEVLEITRNDKASQNIAEVTNVKPADDGRPITLVALWGNDYWQLAYAQAYEGQFPQLNLVDHNADFRKILTRGDHLYTLSRTFYTRPLSTWEERLGAIRLSSVVQGIIEIGPKQKVTAADSVDVYDLYNGIAVRTVSLAWRDPQTLALSVEWHAYSTTNIDYSVAVHLVSQDPPTAPDQILEQADRAHPVEGWYPTSHWEEGEIVQDNYVLSVQPESVPVAVRLGMYRVLADGQFENTQFMSLPIPDRP